MAAVVVKVLAVAGVKPPCSTAEARVRVAVGVSTLGASAAGGAAKQAPVSTAGFSAQMPMGGASAREASPEEEKLTSPYRRRHSTAALKFL
jgi:hypothetical protein